MNNDLNFYINGEWVKSESNELIDVVNPANEELVGHVTAGTKDDIDKAVNAALNAFSTFQHSNLEDSESFLNFTRATGPFVRGEGGGTSKPACAAQLFCHLYHEFSSLHVF